MWSNSILFDFEHGFSQQLRVTLHSSLWELLDVSASALAWFLSLIDFHSQLKVFILICTNRKRERVLT